MEESVYERLPALNWGSRQSRMCSDAKSHYVRLDVIDAADILSPSRFVSHLAEFAVLYHHDVDNAKEALIRRKEARGSRQCIALQQTLAQGF